MVEAVQLWLLKKPRYWSRQFCAGTRAGLNWDRGVERSLEGSRADMAKGSTKRMRSGPISVGDRAQSSAPSKSIPRRSGTRGSIIRAMLERERRHLYQESIIFRVFGHVRLGARYRLDDGV